MLRNSLNFRILKISGLFLLLLGMAGSCQCSGQEKHRAPDDSRPREEARRKFEDRKGFHQKEDQSIRYYLEDRELQMKRSGTGLYFKVFPDSTRRDRIEPGDDVYFRSYVHLLDGTPIYQENRRLRVDREDAVVGLHEALQKMTPGDSGSFVLPSHLAYGVAGDQDRVPPLTALHYYIKITDVNSNPKTAN